MNESVLRVPARSRPFRGGFQTRVAGEEGSTLVLTIFYSALALVVILVVAAATSLYLERKRLLALADAAALVGAEAFELSSVSFTEAMPELTLDSAAVNSAVEEFISGNPVGSFDSLSIERATSLDGRSATVTVSSAWTPPVLTLFVPEGIRIDATSVARSVLD